MIVVGRALGGASAESRLYARDFEHGYRKADPA
jgi:precorrin-4 methylase